MENIGKKTATLWVMLLVCCSIAAQMLQPVKVESELVMGENNTGVMTFRMQIDEGWHVYGPVQAADGPTAAKLNVETSVGAELESGLTYEGKLERMMDEVFEQEVEFFEGKVTFKQNVKLADAENFRLQGYLEYGVCNNQSCLPPMKAEFDWGTADPVEAEIVSSTTGETSQIGFEAKKEGLLWLFIWGLIGGLIALTTPCVWPIIPMTVSFFLKRGGGVKDAVTYGLSIIIIYVGLGLLVTGLFGANALNSLATNAVFNVVFFFILMLFGLSLMGLYEITLPASWTTSVDDRASKTTGFAALFLMAFTLALVSFSCTGPIIGFLLVELATDGGSVFAPAVGMLGFSLGLALPFTVFAMFPGWLKAMPKSGSWMETVKKVLGVVEVAFSLKFLSVADLAYGWGLLSRRLFFVLWIILFGGLGIYLIVQMIKARNARPVFYVLHTLVAAASLMLAAYMVPGLWGEPCTLVSAFAPPMERTGEEQDKVFTDYETGLEYAQTEGRPVMIDFSGYGCVNCRKMEAAVFTNPKVASIIYDEYVFIQLFVDDRTPLNPIQEVMENGRAKKLRTLGDKWSHLQAAKYGANSQPFYILTDGKGNLLAEPYAYDEDIDKFIEWLQKGLNKFNKQ